MLRPLLRYPFAAMSALFLAVFLSAAYAQLEEVYPVRSGSATQSLNGSWQFKYLAGPEVGADAAFTSPEFSDAKWSSIAVPGHWELQGFAEPKYAKVDEGTGLYRRTFRVPAAWKDQRVFLHFEGVLYGFDAWVNGAKVGSWASAYNPASFDITDFLQPGGDNLLAVQVSTRSHGFGFDINDCWALSGIYRDVSLFAVPTGHFTDFSHRTTLNPDGTASLSVTTTTTLNNLAGAVSGRLLGPDGQLVAPLEFSSYKPTVATADLKIDHPQLWTAETPTLYTLELALSSGQRVSEKIGLREITIANGVLLLNGRPIKLRGVDHHDIWPVNGRVATEELMRRDLELIRAANCNFVRTSHYPPHPRLLELCDELGLYVMDEVPFGFGEEHLNDPAYQDDLFIRARATVRRDHNRPSVIIWSVGNENENTPLTIATARRVKELDSSRPVCFPQIGGYFDKSYTELPTDIDIYAPHYPSTARVREDAEKLTRPVIFTEYAHALGLATDQIQAQWAIIQASPRLAGGAIWMFQDQGILRQAKSGQTPATSHNLGIAVWPDASHYYDTEGNRGMDGIVYSDRTPQVDYWQVRKVYSPVQITAANLDLKPGANELSVQVENRFDFRALTGLTLAWSLVHNGQAGQTGSLPLQTAARSTETLKLAASWTATQANTINQLNLRVLDERGVALYERNFPLQIERIHRTRNPDLFTDGLARSELSLQESAAAYTVTHSEFTLTMTRATGEITLRDAKGTMLASGLRPHAGRRFTEGEFVRLQREQTWTGDLLTAAPGIETSTVRTAGGDIALRVRGKYPRPDAPEQSLEGELNLLIRPNGMIEVNYDYTPVNSKGLLLEAGVALTAPETATEFQWIGDGPYAGYPGKDALNEFGIYHLNRDDLNFSGNRRSVSAATLATPQGAGVLLLCAGSGPTDVAVERTSTGAILSHNALLSGRGTKFVGPDTFLKAEAAPHITGKFTLIPLLPGKWPAPFRSWFGAPSAAKPFHPYFHGYDQ